MRRELPVLLLLCCACPKDGDGTTATETTTSTASTASTASTEATAGEPGTPMYCPGVQKNPPECLSMADCEQFDQCVPALPRNDCPGPGCQSDCMQDSECEALTDDPTYVCVIPLVGCCKDFGGLCAPNCLEVPCAATDTCQSDGHCFPTSCDDGYTCPEGQACTPGAAGTDLHGCVGIPCGQPGALACSVVAACVDGVCQNLPCVGDGDCPCGNCIAGQCWERPWVCYHPPE